MPNWTSENSGAAASAAGGAAAAIAAKKVYVRLRPTGANEMANGTCAS